MPRPDGNARGFTLVEFSIVAAMSALVVFTLAAFYINAQHMWLDSSLQAMTQRDASLFLDVITDQAAVADSAVVSGDSTDLYLYRLGYPTSSYTWDPGDPHVRMTKFDPATGLETSASWWPATGEVASLRFRIPPGSGHLVALDSLTVITSPGERVFLSTAFLLSNRP